MATTIYGASDDLIEFEGDVRGEVSCYGTDKDESKGVLLSCSDGTVLVAKYGKANKAIWALTLVERGSLFESIELCTDDDADPYSDVARFRDGLKWVYASTEWERVA